MPQNFSHLSDEDLLKASVAPAPAKPQTFDHLSDDELLSLSTGVAPKEGLGSSIMRGVSEVGRAIDKYTGAPTRSALSAALDLKNPLTAYVQQFGQPPERAPTGEDIAARQLGVSEKPLIPEAGPVAKALTQPLNYLGPLAQALPEGLKAKLIPPLSDVSRAKLAGTAINVAADPTNLIGLGELATAGKMAGKGVLGAARLGAKVVGKVGEVGAEAVGLGNAYRVGVESAKGAGENALNALKTLAKPKQAEDFADLARIAEKNGIDPATLPASVEFGPSSYGARASRSYREGPAGSADLEAFHQSQLGVQNAFDKKVQAIAGGAPKSAPDAGNLIKDAYDNAVNRVFDGMDITYQKVLPYAPGIKLNPDEAQNVIAAVNGMDRYANNLAKRGITANDKAAGAALQNAVNGMRATYQTRLLNGQKITNISLKQGIEALQMLGRAAFKSQNELTQVPGDIQKLRDLYGTIRDGVINTIGKQVNPEFANELIENNKIISEFNKDASKVTGIIGRKNASPEDIFNSLGPNGGTDQIAVLKARFSPEEVNQIKGSIIESMIKRGPDGQFSFRTLGTAMAKKKDVLKAWFEPGEIQDLADIVKLGQRYGEPVLSTSGTGGSVEFSNLKDSILRSFVNKQTLDQWKNAARQNSAAAQGAAAVVKPSPLQGASSVAPKALQVLSVERQKQNQKEDAMKRRLRQMNQ